MKAEESDSRPRPAIVRVIQCAKLKRILRAECNVDDEGFSQYFVSLNSAFLGPQSGLKASL